MKPRLFRKYLAVLLVMIMIIGFVPNNRIFAEENEAAVTEELIQEAVGNEGEIEVQNTQEELTVEADLSFDEAVYDIPQDTTVEDIVQEEGTSSTTDENLNITDADVSLTLDHDTNEFTLSSIETDDNGNERVKEYKVLIENATEEGIVAKFVDAKTGEEYHVNTNELEASFAFLVPIGVVIGEALLAHLISIGLAIVIGGVTYTLASEIASKLKNKNYDHYAAYLNTSKGVYIGDPISFSTAVARLNGSTFSSNNVWSKNGTLAKKVAQSAGGGRTPVFDGPHGTYPKFLPHFHKWNRSGGHSFYSY
ncbi:hypothetical protein CU633_03980 [Bacillus sp. V3-13]|uniref:SAR2788 family putative toxin n=1 Tax=Bacillus sp. V3-13 TaxID=2053728 RepID=UPI000C7853E5|nr:SAR2788 family putative toxin [Bacillus sp. V3-13]PLR78720.1 hypothetical protein CU633_03980 [Bacillus sp. V3-13]